MLGTCHYDLGGYGPSWLACRLVCASRVCERTCTWCILTRFRRTYKHAILDSVSFVGYQDPLHSCVLDTFLVRVWQLLPFLKAAWEGKFLCTAADCREDDSCSSFYLKFLPRCLRGASMCSKRGVVQLERALLCTVFIPTVSKQDVNCFLKCTKTITY